jgi:hypothetical protein
MSRPPLVRATLLLVTLVSLIGCQERRRTPGVVLPAQVTMRSALPTPAPPPRSCGNAGEPDCPLQAWMDDRLNAELGHGNYSQLARSLRTLAEDAPAGLHNWRRWAEIGARAADDRDADGVRSACNGCHDEHRRQYRNLMRARPVPTLLD